MNRIKTYQSLTILFGVTGAALAIMGMMPIAGASFLASAVFAVSWAIESKRNKRHHDDDGYAGPYGH